MRSSLLLLALASCAAAPQAQWAYGDGAPTVEKTSAAVSPKEIAQAANAGLPKLSAARLPDGDAEIRFWIVPSFGPAHGIVLRKSGSSFRAMIIDRSGARSATPSDRSWDATWDALANENVFTLPDDSSLPDDGHYILDGSSYTVEVQQGGAYRSYSYGNPADHDWPEATHVLRMAHVLARAFRIRIDDRSPTVRARIPDDDVDASSHAMGAPCDPLDMRQPFCGSSGRVAMEHHRDAKAACDLAPTSSPNGFLACIAGGRVYLGSKESRAVLIADMGEMSDDQRIYIQKRLGIGSATPLRTIAAWRAALR